MESTVTFPPLTPAVQQARGGQQLAQPLYFIFFSVMENLAARNDVPSSPLGWMSAAAFNL